MLHCRSVAQLQIVCRLRGCLCSKCHSSCFLMHACHLHSSYLHPERSTFKARPRTVPCCCWCERQLSSLLAASESRPFSEFTTLVDDDIGAAGADVYILTSRSGQQLLPHFKLQPQQLCNSDTRVQRIAGSSNELHSHDNDIRRIA